MEHQGLDEGIFQFRLGRAWDAYAASLGNARHETGAADSWEELAQQFRRQVVDRFLFIELVPGVREKIADLRGQPLDVHVPPPATTTLPPEDIAAVWIAQAQAIHAWPGLATHAAKLQTKDVGRQRWANLRQACIDAQHQLSNGNQSAWQRLMSPAKARKAGDQACVLLEQCQSAFAQLGEDRLSAATDFDTGVARHVQQLLSEPANDWPPQRLVELQDWLTELDPQWHCLLERLSSPYGYRGMWPEWSRWLARIFPESSPTARARLILVRAVVLALDVPSPPEGLRAGLEEVIRLLLASSGLVAVLVHDSRPQPAEWFVTITDPAIGTTQPGRFGLALRHGTGPWTCCLCAERRAGARIAEPELKETIPVAQCDVANAATTVQVVAAQTPVELAQADLDALAKQTEACVTAAQSPAISYCLRQELAQELEKKWLRVQQDCEHQGLEIVPARWSFLETQLWETLELPQTCLDAVFCNDVAKGVAFRVKTFVVRKPGGESLRECTVCVSGGPCPAGFAELYAIVQNPSSPGEESLKQRLLRWPKACLLNAIEAAAERLFTDFWGSLGDEMRTSRKPEAGRFADRLSFLLAQELRWRTFHPRHFQEYPTGWLQVETERGAVTGEVRRVIRPGVKDADGNLRVQAKVDID